MKKWLSIGSLLLGMLVFSHAEVLTLVPSSAQWKYDKGTKEPSTSVGTWRTIAFDDSNWSSASAPFYYGGNITQGTQLSDMRYNYRRLFAKKTISPPSALMKIEPEPFAMTASFFGLMAKRCFDLMFLPEKLLLMMWHPMS
jgi:hypothetical protein